MANRTQAHFVLTEQNHIQKKTNFPVPSLFIIESIPKLLFQFYFNLMNLV